MDNRWYAYLLVAATMNAPLVHAGDEVLDSFLKDQCSHCHSAPTHKGGLDLQQVGSDLSDPDVLRRWERIHDRVARGEMPPKTESQPDKVAVHRFLESLSDRLTRADAASRRVVLRRLNRVEYEHTVQDLFGIRAAVKEMLPEDSPSYGFDTVGDALAISPEQMELYLQSAAVAVSQIFGTDVKPPQISVQKPMGTDRYTSQNIGKLFLKTDDDSLVAFQDQYCPSVFSSGKASVDGTYRVRIQAKAYQSNRTITMAVYGGGVSGGPNSTHIVGYYDVGPGDQWTTVTFEDFLEKGGNYKMTPYGIRTPTQGPDRFKGPGLMLGEVSFEGPLEEWPPVSRKNLLGDIDVKSAGLGEARAILSRLLPRAFRRRVEVAEIEPFIALTKSALDAKRPFVDALSVALKAMLCCPQFLMREEPFAPDPASKRQTISNEALASRISYFLWSSMPDDELLRIAAAGKLNQPDVLRSQVERMLLDPKSERFVENFTGQWLGLRNIRFTEPDAKLYPEFDELLRESLVKETHLFFRQILDRDLPLLDFVDSDWAMLNERLAQHYGIAGVTGQAFRRVTLPTNSVRGGVMTQASVLKVTANGTTTSPVVRGVWVLENILGRPTPPPPTDIPVIEPDIRGAATAREQLERHRSIESCAGCHNQIDPPGQALEAFDPIGSSRRWYRTLGAGTPVKTEVNRMRAEFRAGRAVNSKGQLADGSTFRDIHDLKQLLLKDKKQIAKCLTEKLLTYSIGRGMGFSDRLAVQEIVDRIEPHKYGFRSLIHEVVQSKTFRQK